MSIFSRVYERTFWFNRLNDYIYLSYSYVDLLRAVLVHMCGEYVKPSVGLLLVIVQCV